MSVFVVYLMREDDLMAEIVEEPLVDSKLIGSLSWETSVGRGEGIGRDWWR